MKFKNYYLLLFCVAALILAAIAYKRGRETVTDVYISGQVFVQHSLFGGSIVAAYWKNGVCTKLSEDSSYCGTKGIAVKGDDVYVLGNYNNINGAVYWENGVEKKLNGYATGIAVSAAGDVYIAGCTTDKNGYTAAVYWKNGGKPIALSTDIHTASTANAVAVNKTGVYFAGDITPIVGFTSAAYWKDGVCIKLGSGSSNSETTAIALNGADVYIAGDTTDTKGYSTPVYWKNNSPAIPFKKSLSPIWTYSVNAIAVNKNNDVYAAGCTAITQTRDLATYWKNNTIGVNLSNGYKTKAIAPNEDEMLYMLEGAAKSIALNGNDVYIAGTANSFDIVYWKNGIINHLEDKGEAPTGIVVVTHTGH